MQRSHDSTSAASKGHHHIALQSARGVAATVVLMSHCLLYFRMGSSATIAARLLEGASHLSVVFFFVLSGFVLGISLAFGQKTIVFYVRRIWRIYPALWVASILALLYVFYVHREVPNQSAWFKQYFRADMFDTKHVVASFLALDLFLITPAWTIFVELVASIFMPFIAKLVRQSAYALALGAATIAVAFVCPGKFYVGVYLPCFVLGAVIAVWRTQGPLKQLHQHASTLKTLAAMALAGSLVFRWSFNWSFHDVIPTLVEAIAAAICVHLLASVHRPRWLENSLLTRLGDISYSLYILHFPLMCFAGIIIAEQMWSPECSAIVLVTATLAITYALATLSYDYVERAGIVAGRNTARLVAFSG